MSNKTYFHLTGICELSGAPIITKDDAPRDDGSLLIQVVNEFGEFTLDEMKNLGADIGFIGVLHTWGQNLVDHPHIHYVVPGGGLNKDKNK